MPRVLILAEIRDKDLHPLSFELIGAGRKMVEENDSHIDVALLGNGVDDLAEGLLARGVDCVYLVESPLLASYSTDAYVIAMSHIVRHSAPEIVMIGQTAIGRDLTPHLAFHENTAVAMDCINLELDASGHLIITRPIYGGSILATYRFGDVMPQIVTIRSRAFEAAKPTAKAGGRIERLPLELEPSQIRVKVLERKLLLKEGQIRLEDAAIIVAGGWGLGSKDNYRVIEELASEIGGVAGASRPICDLGWTDASHHIGLTGKIVAPDLYIAVAISGSMHHMAGCSNSKVMVGINIDPDAPIFKHAKYGIVGDFAEIVPALIRQLAKSRVV